MLNVILLIAAVMVCSGGILFVFLTRETRRLYLFDRRLAISRTELLRRYPQATAGKSGRGESSKLFEEFTLAAVRAVSLLAPFGAKERTKLARMLRTAGIRHPEAVAVYLSAKLAVALVAGAGAGFVAFRLGVFGQHPIVVGFLFLVGAIVGGLLPEIVIRGRSSARNQQMTQALPSALDLLVMSLDAGLTFERAILTTAEELEPIEPNLSDELRLLEAELRVGSDRAHGSPGLPAAHRRAGPAGSCDHTAAERTLRHAPDPGHAEHRPRPSESNGRPGSRSRPSDCRFS